MDHGRSNGRTSASKHSSAAHVSNGACMTSGTYPSMLLRVCLGSLTLNVQIFQCLQAPGCVKAGAIEGGGVYTSASVGRPGVRSVENGRQDSESYIHMYYICVPMRQ